jgi:RHS repeat-associated protein
LSSAQLITEGKTKGKHAGITYLKGDVIQRFEYAAYGRENFALNPNLSWDPAFTGQQYDIETGLYYYRARYYNPILGRFIQADTIVQDPFDPQSWNRYAYVRNNPLKYVDPSGHFELDIGFDLDPSENEHSVAEDAASLDWDGAPSYGSTSDIPDGTYGEVFVDGVPAFADFAGGGGSGSEGGGAGGSVEGGGGYSDRDYGGISVHEEGGLVGASVSENGSGNWSSSGMALTTAELARQYSALPTFGRSMQSVESALGSGNFAHTGGRVYSQAFRGNQYISSASIDLSKTVGRTLRGVGIGLNIAGVGLAILEYRTSNRSGADKARLLGSFAIMGSFYIPYVGPIASIGLGYAEGLGAFDSAYKYFDD